MPINSIIYHAAKMEYEIEYKEPKHKQIGSKY
jgi:hypothetical protein